MKNMEIFEDTLFVAYTSRFLNVTDSVVSPKILLKKKVFFSSQKHIQSMYSQKGNKNALPGVYLTCK